MAAIRFERLAAFSAAALAGMILVCATGAARAQPVTPPVPPQNPTFNPSSPNVVPQPPPAPLAPAPNGPTGAGTVPGEPAILPPALASPPAMVNPPAEVSPAPQATPAATGHHGRRHHGRRHHWRYRRPLGPAYYPGVGEFYPPYPDVCHMSQTWYGYYAPYSVYSCGW